MESKLEVTMCKNRRSALRPLPHIRDQRRDGFGNSGARFSRRQVFYFHRRAAFHGAENRRVLKFVGRRERDKTLLRAKRLDQGALPPTQHLQKAARENGGKSIECRFAEEMSA